MYVPLYGTVASGHMTHEQRRSFFSAFPRSHRSRIAKSRERVAGTTPINLPTGHSSPPCHTHARRQCVGILGTVAGRELRAMQQMHIERRANTAVCCPLGERAAVASPRYAFPALSLFISPPLATISSASVVGSDAMALALVSPSISAAVAVLVGCVVR